MKTFYEKDVIFLKIKRKKEGDLVPIKEKEMKKLFLSTAAVAGQHYYIIIFSL